MQQQKRRNSPEQLFNSEEDLYGYRTSTLSKNINSTKYFISTCFESDESNRNEISKKTNRGRKEIFTLPKDILKCEICQEYSDFSNEKIVSCSICKCLFHKSCYNQYETSNSSFSDEKTEYYCQRCFRAKGLKKPIYDKDFNCFICGNSNKVLNYNPLNRNYYHLICLFFIAELCNLKGEELGKENIRKWRYKNSCKYCGQKLSKSVAVIKCKKPKCKDYYHVPCAIEKGMIFDLKYMKQYYNVNKFEQIPFFCSNHNKKIANEYKNYIIDKIEHSEKKEEKTFLNYNIKNFGENEKNIFETESNDINNLYSRFTSMSIEEDKDTKIEGNENNEDNYSNPDYDEEEEEKIDKMDLDESYDRNKNYLDLQFITDKYKGDLSTGLFIENDK